MSFELSLSKVSRQELLERTSRLVSEERKITAQLLLHLEEIDRRKLHLELGFSSMFDYLTKGHGYSDGAAGRRVEAMRLTRDVPQVASAIETGKISLNVASQVGHFLRNERKAGKVYTSAQKTELTMQMAGKSTRECERELLKISPESARQFGPLGERARAVSATETEIKFVASAELMAKLEHLRALLAHHGNLNYAQLFERLADQELKRIDPMRENKQKPNNAQHDSTQKRGGVVEAERGGVVEAERGGVVEAERGVCVETPAPELKKNRPHIPLADRREVWRRAGGRCEYVDPKTGRRCNSKWALQLDHVTPLGLGGSHELANFRLCCASHNKLLAVKAYGPALMSRYLRKG